MKVLITGGLGYLGSHTTTALLKNDIDCIIVDNLVKSDIKTKNKIKSITNKSFKFIQGDLCNIQDLEEIFEEYDIHAVFHFAGLKSVGESVENPLKYYEKNLKSTINLIKVMEKYNVKQLVFSSSATVYGDINKPPVNETDQTSILNPYGRTKLISEYILEDIVLADKSWSIAVLRYFNPIGAHPSGLIGEVVNDEPNNLMPYLCEVAIGERKILSIYGDDYPTHDGTGIRDYIHVMDLAEGHISALDYIKSNKGYHVFNLGTGKGLSVLELIKKFESANKVKIPYEITDRRKGDIAISYANVKKANRILGWAARRDTNTMCRDAWNWITKQNKNLKY